MDWCKIGRETKIEMDFSQSNTRYTTAWSYDWDLSFNPFTMTQMFSLKQQNIRVIPLHKNFQIQVGVIKDMYKLRTIMLLFFSCFYPLRKVHISKITSKNLYDYILHFIP